MTIVPTDEPSKDAIDAAWLRGFNRAHESHHAQRHETCLQYARLQARANRPRLGAMRLVPTGALDEDIPQ